MDYLIEHLAQSLIVIGLLLLAIEVLVLGFSTFFLLFIGVGAIITGGLIIVGIVPSELVFACFSVAVISALVAIFSWRPLKAMQSHVEVSKPTSDMIGNRFILSQQLIAGQYAAQKYSGVEWQVTATTSIDKGAEVEIVSVDVGKMVVKTA
ncbi:NfeD family protein [Psychrobium sp. 1_MG-2023]|uniref:NfeD family protein n=1 Tax=Psychrobium sp. 1_MG-2023 TaxID=3062624 RepID=UPI000C3386BD|nr:NfeD family protein [Psychrobium sp. 1_MG-2023]MDP2561228.1 NfeD family protein [Psychrobium sp. 1_MG-2023]PKF55269.1 activity regulator of membrane protease YbbK [Alteromonadales bacterium alter-6D02]